VDLQLAMGQGRVAVLVLLPIAASICISGLTLVLCASVLWLAGFDLERLNNKALLWGFVGVAAILNYAAIYWTLLRRGQRPRITLALDQDGIRYKRRTFRFDDICAVR
jgi:hypothetical protein